MLARFDTKNGRAPGCKELGVERNNGYVLFINANGNERARLVDEGGTATVTADSVVETARRVLRKPNLLIVIGDDMTWNDVSRLAHPDVKTPTLDRLASEGMYLSKVFTPAPMCAPTRMALYTGNYPVRNGGHPNHSQVHAGTVSLPHRLKDLGYRVGIVGKTHYAPAACFPFQRIGKGVDGGIKQLPRFIKRSGDEPWCAVVASREPHSPWNKGDAKRYPPDQLTIPPWLADTPQTRRTLSRYYAEVTFLDGQVARCLKALEDTGTANDTVVIFLSEQGASLPGAKWTLYDAGIRASTFVRWPGTIKGGSTSDAVISYVDVLPTLIEIAGGKPPENLDGKSFLGVLTGRSDDHRGAVFAIQTSRGISNGPRAYGIRAVRDGRYKLIRNLHHEARFQNNLTEREGVWSSWREAGSPLAERYVKRPEWEFYDTLQDPHELKNLASTPEHQVRIAAMKQSLRDWMDQQGDLGHATEMDALNRQAPKRAAKGRAASGGN